MTEMEQWSILSNVLNYIHPKNYHNLSINAVNKYKNSLHTSEERDIVELDCGVIPKISRCVHRNSIRGSEHYKV